jgi:gas vesicle protein
MRRFILFLVGALLGLTFGATITLLLTPASGKAMRQGAKNRFEEILGNAKAASEARRKELEAELASLTGVKLDTLNAPKR